jgi:hypothetical protein|tara:strand:+ start:975 stop:1079 length:105 start_codon:yes stop_codon:yes gene_type:complete
MLVAPDGSRIGDHVIAVQITDESSYFDVAGLADE